MFAPRRNEHRPFSGHSPPPKATQSWGPKQQHSIKSHFLKGLSRLRKSSVDTDGEEDQSTGFMGDAELPSAERTCEVGYTYLTFPRTLETDSSLVCVRMSNMEYV